MITKNQATTKPLGAKILKKLPASLGERERVPRDLDGARIVGFGTFKNRSHVEGGGLVIDYVPDGSRLVHRVVLAFNEVAMWVEGRFAETET